jgi:hydantoinase/carbamoylase family amidase
VSLEDDIEAFGQIGRDGEGVTRLAWTAEIEAARAWLLQRLADLGLRASVDEAGNVLGRWESGRGTAILVGSHIDTVPHGGRFDGALGVLSALEAIRQLKQNGIRPSRPIWIAGFNDEEGALLRTSMLGSRAFVGGLDLADLREHGVAVAMAAAGFDLERLPEAKRIDQVGAYLELHIEQGHTLDERGIDIGVVTSIAGLVGLRARFTGETNHAGTTPMRSRRDALVGAARVVLALRNDARRRSDSTANVGSISAEPGAANAVPGRTVIEIDLRSSSRDHFVRLEPRARLLIAEIAAEERLDVDIELVQSKPPVELDPTLQSLIASAAEAEHASSIDIASGAGHDAMLIAPHVPAGMIFVPSRRGISHSPDEFTSPEHCLLGARVLARTLTALVTN